jgi:hypothetical protein
VQADAKSVFNLLFADALELERKASDVEHDGCERVEVGCWYHYLKSDVIRRRAGQRG